MIFKRWTIQLGVLIAFLFLIFSLENNGVGVVTTFSPSHKEETVLRVLTAKEWLNLDPALAWDPASAKIINNIYEGLVKFKPNSVEVEPALATKWDIQQDGKVWIFKLRQGVKFHDGTPFDASAVKFSVERVKSLDGIGYSEMVFGMVETVEVLDKYTVKFTLKYPYAPFLQNLAMPWAAPIVSPAAVMSHGSDFDKHPSGTGPFMLDKWQRGENLVLSANKQHWGKKTQIEKVIFEIDQDSKSRLERLVNGEVDIVDNLAPWDKDQAQQYKLNFINQTGISINYLGFYTNKEPFTSNRIRRAVAMAIDRDKVVNHLYLGMLPQAESYIPPMMLGYGKDLEQYPHNLSESKDLLQQNGFPKGMTLTLITYEETRPYNPAGGEKLAEAIKDQLAVAGIEVIIKSYPWNEYREALRRQEGHFFLYGWVGDNGDPDNFLYTLLTTPQIERGLNLSRYSNPQVDRVLASAQQVNDPKLRQRLYHNAQQTILQDVPWVVFNYGSDMAATAPNVKKFEFQPVGGYYLHNVQK